MSEKKASRVAYGEALVELAKTNDKLVVLDADLSNATMTNGFAKAYPDRFFDMGIAEANMVDVANGMSTMGLLPFCSTFAVFAGRAYDQIRNGVCYPHNNVKFAFTHAGITLGEDGGSHQAVEDIALMRALPGMTVIVPSDATETYQAVEAAAQMNGPVYLRLGRLPCTILPKRPFIIGKANVIKDGTDVALITCGLMVEECEQVAEILAAKGIDAAVINMHTIKPLDVETVKAYAAKCKKIFTVEEHSIIGGLGDAVASELVGMDGITFKKIGINDKFGQSGKPADLLKAYNLTPEQIAQTVLDTIG